MGRQFGSLRGVAILLVVLNHTITFSWNAIQEMGYGPVVVWQNTILVILHHLGFFAVPMFMFISGSFIAYAASGKTDRLLWRTVYASVRRLLGPYLIWTLMFYLYLYLARGESHEPLWYGKSVIVGYPHHFVPILLFYYVITPLLVPLAKRFGYPMLGLILLYQLFLSDYKFHDLLRLTYPAWTHILVPPVIAETFAQWGIYFPLGLVFTLRAKEVAPWLQKVSWGALLVTVVLFVGTAVPNDQIFYFHFAPRLAPLFFILLIPLIKRQAIPWVRHLEEVGKHSYGLYLMNLIILDALILGIVEVAPGLLRLPLLEVIPVFALTVGLSMGVMYLVLRFLPPSAYRLIFG